MPINPAAVGTVSDAVERSWTSKDCLLYAVAVGAGADDPRTELAFTTENTEGVVQQVLPTYGVLLGAGASGSNSALRDVGSFNPAMLVHAGQTLTLHRPIPIEGTVRTVQTLVAIEDKGSGALLTTEAVSVDAHSGQLMFTTRSSAFIRGEGGFGGARRSGGSKASSSLPDRGCDHEVTYCTSPGQALLYRLCGDRNPLHSNPAVASGAGFDRPILHGLCTFGFTGRALLHTLCDSDPARFGSMEGRFTRPVWPGDTLTISMWQDDDDHGTAAWFRTARQDGTIVIDAGRVTLNR
jgi:acyl dehydratase